MKILTTDLKQTTQLANQFCKTITEWITPHDLDTANMLNTTEEYNSSCATHNYCDANEAMFEAWTKVFGELKLNLQDEAHINLWNTAWDVARANKFIPHVFKLYLIRGEDAGRNYVDENIIDEDVQNGTSVKFFDTEDEMKAYIDGMYDMDGYLSYNIITADDYEKINNWEEGEEDNTERN